MNIEDDQINNIHVNIVKKKKVFYKKFNKKTKALSAKTKDEYNIYAIDNSPVNATKSFITSNDNVIFDKIINGENWFYENIERGQELAFGLDMDIKNLDENVSKSEIDNYIINRLDKVKDFFKKKFNIILTDNHFLLTKSDYCIKKKKHSFHVKVIGYKFPCPYAIKYYFNQMGFSEELDGIDSSVYRTGLIRLSLCSKKGQKRPLLPYYINYGEGNEEPSWFYNLKTNLQHKKLFFIKSKWTHVDGYDNVDISEYMSILEEKENKIPDVKNEKIYFEDISDENIKNGCMYDYNSLGELLQIINIERFSNELEWKKLLWILKNQDFNCFPLFNEVSSKADKYDGEEKTKNIWDKAIKNKYPYSIATLKYWAKIDNPNGENNSFSSFMDKTERFNPLHIKQIILDNCSENMKDELQVYDRDKTIRDILIYMNKFFIKLKNLKGKVIFLEQRNKDTIIRDKKNFLDLLEDCNINFKYNIITNDGDIISYDYPVAKLKDIHNAGRLWLASPLKRDVQNLTFYPDENKKFSETFNMFKGIDISYELCKNMETEEDIIPLQEHILNIWCKGKEDVYDYTVKLLAFYLQNLDIKSGVAIVISGDKGTGKSCIIEKFLKIYGDYGKIVPKLENILGNFNSLLKDSLMVYINEATFTGDKNGINKLRNMITSPDVYVNEKFMPQYTVPSFSNFIIDGNGDQLVCNQGEERRFLILETDNKWKGIDTVEKKEYFKNILDISPEAMGKWLYEIDLTNFNPRAIPVTDKVKETRVDSFEPHESFFYNLIDEGIHKIFTEGVPSVYLYDEFLEYTKTSKFQINRNKFGREITKKLNVEYRKNKKMNGEVLRCIKLNSVIDCKKKYEELFGLLLWT